MKQREISIFLAVAFLPLAYFTVAELIKEKDAIRTNRKHVEIKTDKIYFASSAQKSSSIDSRKNKYDSLGPTEKENYPERLSQERSIHITNEQQTVDRLLDLPRIDQDIKLISEGAIVKKRILVKDRPGYFNTRTSSYRLLELYYRGVESSPYKRTVQVANHLLLQTNTPKATSDFNQKLNQLDLRVKQRIDENLLLVEFQNPSLEKLDRIIKSLGEIEGIDHSENNALIFASRRPEKAKGFEEQWELKAPAFDQAYSVSAESIWDYQTNCRPVSVALLDFDFDINDEAFRYEYQSEKKSNLRPMSELTSPKSTKSFTGINDDFQEDLDIKITPSSSHENLPINNKNHASDIAAIIGAAPGSSAITGICWQSKIYSLPVMNSNSGDGTVGDLVKMLAWVRANSDTIGVANLSLETSENSYLLKRALQSLSETTDVTIVVSAGNSGIEISKLSDTATQDPEYRFPASFDLDNMIVVAGVNGWKQKTGSSNYGGAIDIAAPAEGIKLLSDSRSAQTARAAAGGQTTPTQGTSHAAGYVTGTVALLKSFNPAFTTSDIKAMFNKHMPSAPIEGTAHDIKLLNLYDLMGKGDYIPAKLSQEITPKKTGMNESNNKNCNLIAVNQVLSGYKAENKSKCENYCNTVGPMFYRPSSEVKCQFENNDIVTFKKRLP